MKRQLDFPDGIVWTLGLAAFHGSVSANYYADMGFGMASLAVLWALERWALERWAYGPAGRAGSLAGRWTARRLLRR